MSQATQKLDLESLSQFEYAKQMLEQEGMGYIGKAQYIADYTSDVMNTYMGTKAQCDAKYNETMLAGELQFKARARIINERRNELEQEWFDHHTADLEVIEKEFVKRLINKLGLDVHDAIDRVEDFADLLKLVG